MNGEVTGHPAMGQSALNPAATPAAAGDGKPGLSGGEPEQTTGGTGEIAGEQAAVRGADKTRLRREFRALRLVALADAQALILAAARRELPALLPAGQRLGIYWPLAGEVDLRPLAALDLPLALPAVGAEAPQAARLHYRPWRPGDPLAPDLCGIAAPTSAELRPEALGLLLVPALALDPHSGIRLGSGGGWYDRLRADPAWQAVPALAVLPAACVVEGLPRDSWDVPFAGWLDETGLHWIAARPNIAGL